VQKIAGFHGDMSFKRRQIVLENFQKGEIQYIVTTDVLGRGIDIEDLPVVLNYDIPSIPQDYVHRIGRTGRMGKTGWAISFVSRNSQLTEVNYNVLEMNEKHYIENIEKFLGKQLQYRKIPGNFNDEDDGFVDRPDLLEKKKKIKCK